MSIIRFKFIRTDLGRSLAAEATDENGAAVCFAAFPKAKTDEEALSELRKLYPTALPTEALYCEKEIVDALNGKPKSDGLRVRLDGSDFTVAVWDALLKIPYGEVTSYAAIAQRIGRPTAYRAVAQACNRNHIAVIVPCHRVVASNGLLSGFGWGVDNKKILLKREGYTKYC